MKIEIGESLMLSWLKHIKNCQIVQLNWKPSTMAWEYYNDEKIEEIIETTQAYFIESFDLFKKNKGANQIIQQGEIDAFGIQLQGTQVRNVYAVDVAFHESGLNYGSKDETVARVLKKMARMAITIYGYFDTYSATIIFASPKIHNAVLVMLEEQLSILEMLFHEEFNLGFKFELICNESFDERIISTIDGVSSNVADTSELYMRSIQMFKMFSDKDRLSVRKKRDEKLKMLDEVELKSVNRGKYQDMKIGALVRSTLPNLIKSGALSKEEIENLQNVEYSKIKFNVNFPVLKEYDDSLSSFDNRAVGSYTRYYAFTVKFLDKKFIITSEWYEGSKPLYILWLDLNMS